MRPTVAVIETQAIKENYLELRKRLLPGGAMMAVVKANAYGHGDVEVARALEPMGCELFGVALVEEGARLRKAGIKAGIVVLSGVFGRQARDFFKHDLTPVLFDLDTAMLFDRVAGRAGVRKAFHLKLETGMGRLGIGAADLDQFLDGISSCRNLVLDGVMSHLSEAESVDKTFTLAQIDAFKAALARISGRGFRPTYAGISNSAALVDVVDESFNLARPGIMLYGSYPSERFRGIVALRPAMRLSTEVLSLRGVEAGFRVSYGGTFVTDRRSVIATLPIGYADGLPRSLSNKGHVLIRGRRAPIAGRVCMDLVMCDVTGIEGVSVGDEAVIIGAQGSEKITVEELASAAGTIGYEILCNISPRVRRVYR